VAKGKMVATINAIYPVDVFFDNGNMGADFKPNLISTNWPRFVYYNATGY
jgi:hypothetical protein